MLSDWLVAIINPENTFYFRLLILDFSPETITVVYFVVYFVVGHFRIERLNLSRKMVENVQGHYFFYANSKYENKT